LGLFEFLFEPFQFNIEVLIAIDAEVITDTTTIGRDGLVIGNSVEVEEFL
jgi:hypothetical protein